MCPRRSRWGKIYIILHVTIKNKNNWCYKIILFKNRDEQIISSSITEESRITNAGECNNCDATYDEVKLTEERLSIESPKDAGENEQKTENSANLVPDYLEKLQRQNARFDQINGTGEISKEATSAADGAEN